MAAVKVGRGRFDGEVHEPEILVHGDLGPDADVPVDRPRIVFPRVVAGLAGTRDGVERPEQLARANVERTHQAFGVVVRAHGGALAERRSDDHDVFDDGRCRVNADFAGFEVDRLAVAEKGADLQIDHAVGAERVDHRSVFRVERNQAIPGRDVQDAVVAPAVGPVRHAAARQLSRCDGGAASLAKAVGPDQFARLSVERDDRPARSACRVEHAVDRDRCALQLELGPRTEAVGLEAPRDFELAVIGRVDLIERRPAEIQPSAASRHRSFNPRDMVVSSCWR